VNSKRLGKLKLLVLTAAVTVLLTSVSGWAENITKTVDVTSDDGIIIELEKAEGFHGKAFVTVYEVKDGRLLFLNPTSNPGALTPIAKDAKYNTVKGTYSVNLTDDEAEENVKIGVGTYDIIEVIVTEEEGELDSVVVAVGNNAIVVTQADVYEAFPRITGIYLDSGSIKTTGNANADSVVYALDVEEIPEGTYSATLRVLDGSGVWAGSILTATVEVIDEYSGSLKIKRTASGTLVEGGAVGACGLVR